MSEYVSLEQFRQAAAAIRARSDVHPRIGLVLGSGLSALAQSVTDATAIPYGDIPHFPRATVSGHTGQLVLGELEGQPVAVLQGRVHYYEGETMARVTLPIRVLQVLEIEVLIVTNAAGGLNAGFDVGDVMLISDHINLIGMTGQSPLRGPNIDALGPRFPDMSQAYDPQLMALARQVAAEEGIPLREGVYICLAGPTFETPADLRFLRLIGADAVGMSTVPEVTVAQHGGTRVLGLSGITNLAPLPGGPPTEATHEEVLAAGSIIAPRMERIIRGVLRAL
ncbi:MAG: purine-nucleoside phosphorylase [Anaerolineales bacterium]|nr:purine-nucleoside phosphorylase [Anaerolineales bacterium]